MRCLVHRFSFFALAIALGAAAPSASVAAQINYGSANDFGGGGVINYTNVTESSATDPVPLYGAPDVVVNLLDFDPAFSTSSTGGASDITDGQLNFGFTTLPGAGIDTLTLAESGSYTLSGVGSAATSLSYGLYAQVTVLEVDGVPVSPFSLVRSAAMALNLVSNPGMNVPWAQSVLFDLGPALVSNGHGGFTLGVTKGEVVINNTLVSTSQVSDSGSSTAILSKSDLNLTPGGDLDTNEIPEPVSAVLATVAFAGLARRRR